MSVIQYEKNIYYYATRDIEVGEEMLVWYHESYYQFWGVPLVLGQELDQKNGTLTEVVYLDKVVLLEYVFSKHDTDDIFQPVMRLQS